METMEEEVKELLLLAAENWEDTAKSTEYMQLALAKAEDNLDVLVGAYRYFFYKSNGEMALQIADKVIDKVKKAENLPDHWEELEPLLMSRKNEEKIRLYLNAYASKGYLLAKMGNTENAKIITERVKAIDTNRESCATTVFEVLTAPPEADEYD